MKVKKQQESTAMGEEEGVYQWQQWRREQPGF
jgi:hypothetical protein